ncbi:MAG: BadF/BadG/BcrA/BcrD ATPase family protein [Pseudolysinimonas sp.]
MSDPVPGCVVAVDGGGSKTHAVALTIDGELAGRGHGPGSSPHVSGVPQSIEIVDAAVRAAIEAASAGGTDEVAQANIYLSGLDLPPELDEYADAAAALPWTSPTTVVDNDLFALLRTGTESPDAVAVVCGTGVNAIGVRSAGPAGPAAAARFAALGPISGDWGGGSGLGEEALWHAARAEDGRGPETALRAVVLAGMGVASVSELTQDLHFGRRQLPDLAVLAPGVLEAARNGDAIAGTIVDRQAAEVVAFARASLTRLGMLDREVPVVLGGGVIRAADERLIAGIIAGLAEAAPLARAVLLDSPPIVGAGLLALEAAGATPAAVERARTELTAAYSREL